MRPSALLLLLAGAVAAGCNYGFQGGGGFPSHVRTVYIEPLENQTPQFELDQQLFSELLEQLPRALGVRPAGREAADAVVTGRITRYDDAALNYRTDDSGRGADVLQHEVQIGLQVTIVDVKQNLVLWEGNIVGRGQYQPGAESDRDGREKAIEHLVQLLVDGAQSQW